MSFKVVGIGEVLWDLLPGGRQLGGAPANFAYHAKNLGAQARVITRVGNDTLGRDILGQFEHWDIDRSLVQMDPDRPKGRATVALSHEGVPQFVIDDNAAWDHLAAPREEAAAVRGADAICFGSLAQRSPAGAAAIQRLAAAAAFPTLRIFDLNLRQDFHDQEVVARSLTMADVLKLNDQELPVLAQLFALTGSARQQLEQMAERFDLQLVALTRGGQGSLLDRGGGKLLAAAGGAVRLRDHQRNFVAGRKQRFQGGHGKLRSPAEDQFHGFTTRPRFAFCGSCAG